MRRRSIAYHEAGHAVVAHRLGVEVEHVTIVPDHTSRGHITHGDLFCAHGRGSDRANLERAIAICLAGPLAQAWLLRRYSERRCGDARTTIVPLGSPATSLAQRASANSCAVRSGAPMHWSSNIGTRLSLSLAHCLSVISLVALKSST
jgi:Peptidase family M41